MTDKNANKNTAKKKDLYSLLHQVSISMGRGPRQGLAVRPGQNKVLKILEEHGTMRQRDLKEQLGISAASLTELLHKLETAGLITRTPSASNGRENMIQITEAGHVSALERKLSEKNRDEELFSALTQDERDELTRILDKLLKVWRENDDETEGQRRERRWRENAQAQDEEREINALLDQVASEQ